MIIMKQIASFTIDHMKLLRGVYVSRKDKINEEILTTFDIRMTRPNFEPCDGYCANARHRTFRCNIS